MRNSYDIIEIDIYVILSTLQIFIAKNILFLSIDFILFLSIDFRTLDVRKIFKTTVILITKYLNLSWNIVKKIIFIKKMVNYK